MRFFKSTKSAVSPLLCPNDDIWQCLAKRRQLFLGLVTMSPAGHRAKLALSLELTAASPSHSAATKAEARARVLHGLTGPKATGHICAEETASPTKSTL